MNENSTSVSEMYFYYNLSASSGYVTIDKAYGHVGLIMDNPHDLRLHLLPQ